MVRKWSSAFVKLCVGITVTSTAPPPFPKFFPAQLPMMPLSCFLPPFHPPTPPLAHIPLHTHAHIECSTKGGRTTAWFQLHKHNFWQHYYTLEPTVFFFFLQREPLFMFLSTRCLTSDPLVQFHSRLNGWVGAFASSIVPL